MKICDRCAGHGGDYWCETSTEHCKENPLEGREEIERGQIEWFRINSN